MKEHLYSRVTRELMELVSIEQFSVNGVLKDDRLLVSGFTEGKVNVYVYDGGSLVKLNRGLIYAVAEASRDASRVVIARDVEFGREQSQIIILDPERPGFEQPIEDMKPLRILGIAYDDKLIVYSGSTMTEIALYVIDDEGVVKKITSYPRMAFVTDYKGDIAAGIGMFSGLRGRMDVFATYLDTGETIFYSPPDGSAETVRIMGDGKLLYAVERKRDSILMKLDLSSLEPEPVDFRHEDLKEFSPVGFNYLGFTKDGRILAVARKEGRSRIFVDGRLIEAPHGFYSSVYDWKDGFVASYSSVRTPPIVLFLDGKGGYKPLISGKVPEWLYNVIGDTNLVYVESYDGERVPVFYTISERAGKPGPTIVLVHGGPFSEDMDVWSTMAASLLAAGFNIVRPNYRGSTGYGNEWRLKIIGDPCGGELEDITSAARWAIDNGIASEIYVMGYSYGGYMTLCSLAKKPGLYKAGVAGASVVDWEEMYELSDSVFKNFIDMLFGGKRGLMKERSPITYAQYIRDPLAIIHSSNDTRTPLKPVLKMMQKLSERGFGFEAHIIPNMGHYISTADDVVKILLPAVLFLLRIRGEEK